MGVPVVTCPGRFMRGRHAFAMLTRMGLRQTIAKDIHDYCRIAVRLALDPEHYQAAKAGIEARRHKLYNDQVFMAALEQFYQDLCLPSRSGA